MAALHGGNHRSGLQVLFPLLTTKDKKFIQYDSEDFSYN